MLPGCHDIPKIQLNQSRQKYIVITIRVFIMLNVQILENDIISLFAALLRAESSIIENVAIITTNDSLIICNINSTIWVIIVIYCPSTL